MPGSSSTSGPASPPWITVIIIVGVFVIFFLVLFLLLRGALYFRGVMKNRRGGGGRDVEAQHRSARSSFDSSATSVSQPLPLYPKPPSYKSRETLLYAVGPGPGAESTTSDRLPQR